MKNFLMFLILTAFLPIIVLAEAPAVYIPFDDSPEVYVDGVPQTGTLSGKRIFTQGINGKACIIQRHAYDQVTTFNASNLPSMDFRQGTLAFWLKPQWNALDEKTAWIIKLNFSKQASLYFLKYKNGTFDYTILAPSQAQITTRPKINAEEWHHFALTWDLEKKTSKLYLDGKQIGATGTFRGECNSGLLENINPDLWLGQEGDDRFKALVADAAYDEVKIFKKALDEAEISSIMSSNQEAALKKIAIGDLIEQNTLKICFSLPENEILTPQVIFRLKNPEGLTVSAISGGRTGKLRLFNELNGKSQSFESNYILDWREKHLIELKNDKDGLVFSIDGAEQKKFPFKTEWRQTEFSVAQSAELAKADTIYQDASGKLNISALSAYQLKIWNLEDAFKDETMWRKRISLNGMWQTIPVNAYSVLPPDKWGYSRIPGSYRSPLFQIYTEKDGKEFSLKGEWEGKNLIEYRAGWHRRAFKVPEELKNKQIFLNFEHLNGDYARIYFNGKLIDSFQNQSNYYTFIKTPRRINISKLLKEDLNTITVFIDRRYSKFYQGKPCIGDFADYQVGDVWLEAQEGELELASVLAFPSLAKQSVQFRVRIKNPEGISGKAKLKIAFKRSGVTEQEFDQTIDMNEEKSQTVIFSGSWKNPLIWNAYQPELYSMESSISLNGNPSDSLPPVSWGFREFTVKNGSFFLNGLKTRLRMWTNPALPRVTAYYGSKEGLTEYVAAIKSLNFDTVRENPAIGLETQAARSEYLSECDKQGLYNLFPIISFEEGYDLEAYNKDLLRFLEAMGNHPSIILWYTDFNTCSYPWNQDPAKLNDKEYMPRMHAARRQAAQYAGESMKLIDPSREWFSHSGGNLGNIFTSMNYQSLGTPIQEQADWPAQWSAKHSQPLMVVESGFPFIPQLSHFDSKNNVYMLAEHAARFLGNEAFRNQKHASPNRKIGFTGTPSYGWEDNYIAIKKLLMNQVVRSWRTYDVSAVGDFAGGPNFSEQFKAYSNSNVVYKIDNDIKKPGLKPDCFDGFSENQRHMNVDYSKPFLPLWTLQRECNAPLLIYLGGAPEKFTNKDHAFFSGERFTKSIIAVNDYPWASKFKFTWQLLNENNSQIIDQNSGSCEASAGEIIKIPISMRAPEVLTKTYAKLKLIITKDGQIFTTDEMALQFFPRSKPEQYKTTALLFDPQGETETMLKKANFPYKKLNGMEDIKSAELLIIGKNALTNENPEILRELEKSQAIENGLKLLLFEQKQCNFANLIFESPSYRNAFIRIHDSPYVAGLSDDDLSNWRGGTDTVPEYVISEEESPHYPRSKWKCGNDGIVSGYVIRKPHWGNFRVIIDSGFNQMFANLMEMRKGRGKILLCQLDLTHRYGLDPVASILANNILKEMGTPFTPVHFNRTAYLGDEMTAKYLAESGVSFEQIKMEKEIWKLYQYQNIIISKLPDNVKVRKELKTIVESCLKSGANILALADAPLDIFPYQIERAKTINFRFPIPDNPLFSGIAEADLYFREPDKFLVLNGPEWMLGKNSVMGILPEGNGSAVFFNLAITDVKNDMWKKEKLARLLSSILTNMNTDQTQKINLFSSAMFRSNTRKQELGIIEPSDWHLKLDMKNEGLDKSWQTIPFQNAKKIKVPGIWEGQGITDINPSYSYPQNISKNLIRPYDGYAWYDTSIFIPASWKNAVITFKSGIIDDCDWTYINGHLIGTTNFDNTPSPWTVSRTYKIPNEILKFDSENLLRIRVFDRWGGGGICGKLTISADTTNAEPSWSPYIPETDFYDVDAFHNW